METESAEPAEPPERRGAPSLKVELHLLRAAKRALERDDFTAAALSLRRHREGFARGALVQEREALRIVLACRRGLREQAAQRARAFARRFGDAALAASVDRSCRE